MTEETLTRKYALGFFINKAVITETKKLINAFKKLSKTIIKMKIK